MILAEEDPHKAMLIARAVAINSYAMLEQQLALLMAELGKMDPGVAASIFFRISSARSRLTIISDFIKRFAPKENRLFWNSLEKRIGQLNDQRNQIVHWVQSSDWGAVSQGATKTFPINTILTPNNLYWQNENTPNLEVSNVLYFQDACTMVSMTTALFIISLRGAAQPRFRQIFLEPIPNPIPEDHPLYLQPSEWRIPR